MNLTLSTLQKQSDGRRNLCWSLALLHSQFSESKYTFKVSHSWVLQNRNIIIEQLGRSSCVRMSGAEYIEKVIMIKKKKKRLEEDKHFWWRHTFGSSFIYLFIFLSSSVLFKSLSIARKMDLNYELHGTYSCIFNFIPSKDRWC